MPKHYHNWIIPLHTHTHFLDMMLHLIYCYVSFGTMVSKELQAAQQRLFLTKMVKLVIVKTKYSSIIKSKRHPQNVCSSKTNLCVCLFVTHHWRHLIPVLKYKHFFHAFILSYQNLLFVFYWCFSFSAFLFSPLTSWGQQTNSACLIQTQELQKLKRRIPWQKNPLWW